MALEKHLEALKKKHADIDRQLQEEYLSSAADSLIVNRLKSLKLNVKDEIARLSREAQAA